MPGDPRSDSEPVFAASWEATAFALQVELIERGVFTPAEWAEALGREIAANDLADDAEGTAYYRYWMRALERLVTEKGLAASATIADRREAWRRAAEATPHGEPIVLGRDADRRR